MTYMDRACDDFLRSTIPPGLKRVIDDALARGCSRADVLAMVRRALVQNGRTPDNIVGLQVEAYLGEVR